MKRLVAIGAVALCTGCTATTRDIARASVVLSAQALAESMPLCRDAASLQEAQAGIKTARTCVEAYHIARPSIEAAASSVDAWDAGSRRNVVCAIGRAAVAVARALDAIAAAGGTVPLALRDAASLAEKIGGECK
jgi:hypothetical protein